MPDVRRTFRSLGRVWFWLLVAIGSVGASPAYAQAGRQVSIPDAESQKVIDLNQVNLMTGKLQLTVPELSIGSKENQLSYERYWTADGWRHNFVLMITSSKSGFQTDVAIGNQTKSFRKDASGAYVSIENEDVHLVSSGNTLTYTDRVGNSILFQTIAGGASYYGWNAPVGTVWTKPNGETIRLAYKLAQVPVGGGVIGTGLRLMSVSSSYGYQLKFAYIPTQFWDAVSVTAINNAIDYCDPLADTCAGLTQSWPTVSSGWSTDANSVTTEQRTDALNRTTVYTITPDFDSVPQLTGIRRPTSTTDTVVLTYSAKQKRVRSVTYGTDVWNYSFSNNLVGGFYATVTDPLLGVSKFSNEGTATGSIRTFTDPLNRVSTEEFDTNIRLVKSTQPEGNKITYAYDARGNVIEVRKTAKSGSGLADVVVSASYPVSCTNQATCNKPLTITDAKGNVTSYAYDPTHGGIVSVTSPTAVSGGIAPQTRYTYSALQAYYKGASGVVSNSGQGQYLLTATSQCQTSSSCIGTADETRSTTGFGPQSAGVPNNLAVASSTLTSGDGTLVSTTALGYDSVGNLVTVDGPLAGTADTTRTRFDAARQVVGRVGPDPDGAGSRLPRATRNSYDLSGRLTKVEIGAVADQSDAAWALFAPVQAVDTVYDMRDRKVSEAVSGGGVTTGFAHYSYDMIGRLQCTAVRMTPSLWASQTDACVPNVPASGEADRVTKRIYDLAGQLLKTQVGVGTSVAADEETNSYTQNGKLATVTDGENNTTTFEYDGHDRLFKTRYPVPTLGALSSSTTDFEQYTYDANGNVIQRRLRDGQLINNTFDNLNRVTLKDVPNLVAGEQDVTYAYDLGNRVTSLTNAGGTPITYSYDALGRRLTESFSTYTKTSGYDAAGKRTSLTLPGSALTINYDYDAAGNMTAVRENGAISGLGVLATYGYDNLGRRTSITRGNGTVTNYGYDAVSRLASFGQDLASTTNDLSVSSITYNPASQQISQTRSNDSYAWTGHYNVNRAYGTNGLNQLTTAGATALGYDGRGNLTASGTTTYSYTSENRMALSQVSGQPGVAMLYDLSGRLWQLTKAASVTRFDYDGSDLIMETDGAGNILRRYVPGAGTDEPLVWYEGAGLTDKRWLHTDERGSIIAISNTAGTSIALNKYDEFGIPLSTNMGRFGYTGQTWLGEVGLNYYKARMYSPTLGRFMQTDPIGYKDGINWYDYVANDPVNNVDPDGLSCVQASDGKGYNCVVDNPGKATPAQLDKANKQYTSAVNKLMYNPSKTQTVSVRSGNGVKGTAISNGQIAKVLIGAKVSFGGASPKFSNLPGKGTVNASTVGHVGDRGGVRITLYSEGVAQKGDGLSRTITHEGTHGTSGDAALRQGHMGNFQTDHQQGYKGSAASRLEDYDDD